MWVDTPVKTPAWRRRHSRRACFPGQGRGGPPRGRCRHTMAVGALVPPDATLAAQQCTQMPQNGSKGPFSPICVHSCVFTSVHNVATVYTNAPKRLREAVFADLCTLLSHHGRPRDRVGLRVPRHQRPHGPRDARALGPDGPSVSCQVHVPVGPLPVWSSVCPCVWCRRWLESKTHASVGQTHPQSRSPKLWGARLGVWSVIQLSNEFAACVAVTHAASRYSWTTTTSPMSVRS